MPRHPVSPFLGYLRLGTRKPGLDSQSCWRGWFSLLYHCSTKCSSGMQKPGGKSLLLISDRINLDLPPPRRLPYLPGYNHPLAQGILKEALQSEWHQPDNPIEMIRAEARPETHTGFLQSLFSRTRCLGFKGAEHLGKEKIAYILSYRPFPSAPRQLLSGWGQGRGRNIFKEKLGVCLPPGCYDRERSLAAKAFLSSGSHNSCYFN